MCLSVVELKTGSSDLMEVQFSATQLVPQSCVSRFSSSASKFCHRQRRSTPRNRPDELDMNPVLSANPYELSIACISQWRVFLCLGRTNYTHLCKNKVNRKTTTSVCGGTKTHILMYCYCYVSIFALGDTNNIQKHVDNGCKFMYPEHYSM